MLLNSFKATASSWNIFYTKSGLKYKNQFGVYQGKPKKMGKGHGYAVNGNLS